jgi:thiamine-monophosphate kinase
MTEEELLAGITGLVGGFARRVLVGIGDDAAVWQPSRSHRSVITSDALVEEVHFSTRTMSLQEAGWRAMTANLSDLAAMGARPVLATVSLGVSPRMDVEAVLACYEGIARCARAGKIAIAGGDLTRAPVLTIAISAVGEVRRSDLKLRSGAREGDVLAVTGALGASRAGLLHAQGAIALDPAAAREALEAHRVPAARIAEGRWLAKSAHVHAMMDCSDGLSTDLARLCTASHRGARLDAIPVADSARAAADLLEEPAERFALAGGEDFELLVAIASRAYGHLAARFAARFGRPLHRIGVVRADEHVTLVKEDGEIVLEPAGWDHFAGHA